MNGSFVVSMLAGVTFVTAGSLAAVRLARTSRAATRHVWLASSFSATGTGRMNTRLLSAPNAIVCKLTSWTL